MWGLGKKHHEKLLRHLQRSRIPSDFRPFERKNEVSTELRHSLNKMANRIDRGFNIELRVAPPKEELEENQTWAMRAETDWSRCGKLSSRPRK
uniref:Uncharacterized protein n=1 Tax=Candidatus Kentrum sp. LFY TaxID=2126342 RepID=A0A450X4Z7_9GAMM|nr:MAG: hypothetical protein BECKLFY1418C_GA0070996_11743 [Candidatus Kentron sp. LFY]